MKFDVFISYPHEEKAAADAACAALELAKVRCWIAPRDVAPGAEWASAIVHAIDNCSAMVLIFSSHTNRSRQIRREVQRAFDREKPVIPLRIENVSPEQSLAYYMGPVHWLDALTQPLEQHLQKLVLSVKPFVEQTVSSGKGGYENNPQGPIGVAHQPDLGAAKSSNDALGSTSSSRVHKLSNRGSSKWWISIIVIVSLGVFGFWYAIHFSLQGRQTSTAFPAPGNRTPDALSTSPLADIIAAANGGDPVAENALGIKYAQGESGLPHDNAKAVELYQDSARQGYDKAETNLADMFFFGRGGLAQSYAAALSWYLKAAQQGSPDAQYRLGYMYENGLGADKDAQRAVQFYRSSAEHGNAEAENVLGILYATGSGGVTEDYKQAVTWYQKSADQGDAKAEKNLGDMYFFGRGVDLDYRQALVWYGKAADQQFADAQFRLGYMYEKGLGVTADETAALDLYKKAASNGSVEAQRAIDRLSRGQ